MTISRPTGSYNEQEWFECLEEVPKELRMLGREVERMCIKSQSETLTWENWLDHSEASKLILKEYFTYTKYNCPKIGDEF